MLNRCKKGRKRKEGWAAWDKLVLDKLTKKMSSFISSCETVIYVLKKSEKTPLFKEKVP